MSKPDKEKTKQIGNYVATYGILVATAMILSYVEMQIPTFVAIPGIKIGLTNIVVVVMLYLYGEKNALLINIVRILLVAILFGNALSLYYSISGAIFSFIVMVVSKNKLHLKTITVSVLGAVAHNVAQVIMAMFLLQTKSLGWYMIVLWFTGILSGLVIGFLAAKVTNALMKYGV